VLETGSPNKYFDGLAAGKLIIINFGGWIREEVEAQACGLYVDPQNPGMFCEKIKPFLDNHELQKQYSEASRALAEQKYSRKELSRRFAELFRAN
jgi:glycosyltransferase involved in cell wall biosynthesis